VLKPNKESAGQYPKVEFPETLANALSGSTKPAARGRPRCWRPWIGAVWRETQLPRTVAGGEEADRKKTGNRETTHTIGARPPASHSVELALRPAVER